MTARASKRKRPREESLLKSQDVDGFFNEFYKESDRATAILAAALLDEKLRQLLEAFFVEDKKQVDKLLEDQAPLGSFGARINASYCLGLLSHDAHAMLILIKGIRNAFAHQLHGLSFDDSRIAKDCDKLKAFLPVQPAFLETPRKVFMTATLSARLGVSRSSGACARCKVPDWPIVKAVIGSAHS